MSKYVYFFGGGKADGRADMKDLLGGKGANLAEMTNIGLPVPAGFTITTEVCTYFYAHQHQYPAELKDQVQAAMRQTEALMGATFGDPKNPLLVSCRSGARVSMPGMMDTVLNIGLNEATLKGLIDKTGNERFAWDSYRRFVQMYGDVVLGLKPQTKTEIDPVRSDHGRGQARSTASSTTPNSTSPTSRNWSSASRRRSRIAPARTSPKTPTIRCGAPSAPSSARGTTIGPSSIAGSTATPTTGALPPTSAPWSSATWAMTAAPASAFTRDPATGEKVFYGEYLINAQGEDVVAGIRTPKKIAELQKDMPPVYEQLDEDPPHPGEALPQRAGHRVHRPEGQALDAANA